MRAKVGNHPAMDLCVMIEGQEDVSWEQWQAIAATCEEHRVPALFRSDHYLPLGSVLDRQVLDAWATLCALAPTTSTLRLGTLVSPATFRHPAVLAKLAVTADHASGGRVEVGLGAGWNDSEHAAFGFPFPDLRTRMAVFEEQLQIVRGLTDPGTFEHRGDHYRVGPVDALPKPVQPRLPIIVGGGATPRSAAAAARFADEYNTPFPEPGDLAPRRAAVARAWDEAGRDLGSLRFSVMTGFLAGRDEGELLDRAGRLADKQASGNSAREELDALPPSWIAGTVDAVTERLRGMADLGVDRVMCQLLLHDDLDQIALIGRDLAPLVR
jgi:alkanesulfonate monooxygenase SsuD/methylene tetrahydromethanopterin reductase-like flavin-dependent oxidoreductase (luciferase family)